MAKEKQTNEPSALSNILDAGAKGLLSPSIGAKIGGNILAPPGAGEVAAQGIQAVLNMAVVGSREFVGAMIRQHGAEHLTVAQKLIIQKAINSHKPVTQANKPAANKGIEAARQKTATSQSANKGITSYQSKTSGQSASVSKSGASSSSKAASAGSGKSSSSSSSGKSSSR